MVSFSAMPNLQKIKIKIKKNPKKKKKRERKEKKKKKKKYPFTPITVMEPAKEQRET